MYIKRIHLNIPVFDRLILVCMFMLVFVIKFYIEDSLQLYNVLFVMFLASILLFRHKLTITYRIILGFVVFVFVLVMNIFLNNIQGDMWYYLQNIIPILKNVFILYYFFILVKYIELKDIKLILYFLIIIYNIFFIINVPIIILQATTHDFILQNWLERNPLIYDHYGGLFGYNGIYDTTFFWFNLLLINSIFFSYFKNKLVFLITIIEMVLIFMFSFMGDNNGFIYLFPIIISQLCFFGRKYISFKKVMILIILLFSIITAAYFLNSDFNTLMNEHTFIKLARIFGNATNSGKGQEERWAFIQYALKNNGLLFGNGLGTSKYISMILSEHFALNELTSKIYEGGIIYYLSIVFLFSSSAVSILKANIKKIKTLPFVVFLNIVILSAYTRIFICSNLVVFIGLFFFTINLFIRLKESEVKKVNN